MASSSRPAPWCRWCGCSAAGCRLGQAGTTERAQVPLTATEAKGGEPATLTGLLTFVLAVILVILFFNFIPVGLWISACASGVHLGTLQLIGMRLRRVPPAKIVLPLIKAVKAGLDVAIDKLEAHYLAGG